MSAFPEYHTFDGLGLADLVRRRQVAPAELVEEAIRRIEAHNPSLNAVIHTLYESARLAAQQTPGDAPFAGVPFLVKDLLATIKGVPTSHGNGFWRQIKAAEDSELVTRWKRAGVLILGKTNTPEFGLTPYTEPGAFGATRNPWDTSRTPGGSSGGSGAAVAARMVPLASGGDGGGSIRIPAAACGIFGLKPTRGRTPTGPQFGEIWRGLAIEHVLTRSVRDSAAMLDATHGEDLGAPFCAPAMRGTFLEHVTTNPGRLRIAFTTRPLLGQQVDPEVKAAVEQTAALLTGLGHAVVEASPALDRRKFSLDLLTILAGELRADAQATRHFARKARKSGTRFEDWKFDAATLGMELLGGAFNAADSARAARDLQAASRRIAAFFTTHDVLLTPTLSKPPVRLGELLLPKPKEWFIRALATLDVCWPIKALRIHQATADEIFEFIPWTPVFNVTGQPAMSVPLHWHQANLPIGMHFVGRFGDEATLLRLAGQLEQARPWQQRIPPGC